MCKYVKLVCTCSAPCRWPLALPCAGGWWGLGNCWGDEMTGTCLWKGELVRVRVCVQRLLQQRRPGVLARDCSRVCKGEGQVMERGAQKDKEKRSGAINKPCSSSILAGWTRWGSANCVTGSAAGFSTWFERHHVVVRLADAAHSGGAAQAQARLPCPAALALHQRVHTSVEPERKIQQTPLVELTWCPRWWTYGRERKPYFMIII